VLSGVVTVCFAMLPDLHLFYQREDAGLVLETCGSLIAVMAAFLVYGRLLRRTYLDELLLASSLAVLALSNLFFVSVPLAAGWAPDDLTMLAAPFARSLGTVLFALAAFVPHRRLWRTGRILPLTGAAVLTTLGLAAIFVHTFIERWREKYASALLPRSLEEPAIHSHPVLLIFELLVALLCVLAAVGFLRRSRLFGDEFLGWLAVAAILAAASHVNYSLFPSLYSENVLYTGDAFRLAFYLALLIGCLREIWSYWNQLSEAAVLHERRRIACDLHDGLAQELAYISRNLDRISRRPGADRAPAADPLRRLRLAVERAQHESRRAISALAPARDQAVEVALAEAAAETADRFRIALELDLIPGVELSPSRTEALVRIACEAITNAARHSGAGTVTLHLQRDGRLVRLRVADRGSGFDTTAPAAGFGLIAMRERASSVGAELHVCSAPGRGSEVEVCV
jgi:signal transduction histidine kinase